jgi:uncharacterized membrane protein
MKKMLLFLFMLSFTLASAIDYNGNLSADDKASFDEILKPVMKVYNLLKYVASAIAILVLLLSGVNYMISGSDPQKRESAKYMAMYVIVGLIIIWAAPLVVNFITGG